MSTPDQKAFEATFSFKDAANGAIEGYGAIFGNRDQGGDIVQRGAFQDDIKSGRHVKMLWQHDPAQVIGVWDSVAEDGNGLRVKGRFLLDVDKGREAYSLVKNGALNGLSIGYRAVETERTRDGARLILKAEVWEVSLVTFPMNQAATLTGVKSLQSEQDVVRLLRASGLPNRAANKIAAGGWPALRGDVMTDAEVKDIAALLNKTAAQMRLNLKG